MALNYDPDSGIMDMEADPESHMVFVCCEFEIGIS